MTKVFNMNAVIKLNECYDEPSGEKLPPHARVGNPNSGGNVDEILKRLDKVESTVSETREQVINIAATMPSLATKADIGAVRIEVSELRTEVRSIAATIPHLATKADLKAEIDTIRGEIGGVKAEIRDVEASIIKWIIGIIISTAGLAFTIAKFVH
jgi:hypothetical protein